MGLFDTIYCEDKIKCSKCKKEIESFQTKKLGLCLQSYVITKDKRLREDWKRYLDENTQAENYNYIENIGFNFYDYCDCGEYNELYAIFIDGKLKKLIHNDKDIKIDG